MSDTVTLDASAMVQQPIQPNGQDSPLAHFFCTQWPLDLFNTIFNEIPADVTNGTELMHYLLVRWDEVTNSRLDKSKLLQFVIVKSTAKRIVPKVMSDGPSKPIFTNLAIDMLESSPEHLVPIPNTNFSICRYPAIQHSRIFENGKRGYKEIGYCYIIIEHVQEEFSEGITYEPFIDEA